MVFVPNYNKVNSNNDNNNNNNNNDNNNLNYFKLGGLKILIKGLYFNRLILMHGGINKPAVVSF